MCGYSHGVLLDPAPVTVPVGLPVATPASGVVAVPVVARPVAVVKPTMFGVHVVAASLPEVAAWTCTDITDTSWTFSGAHSPSAKMVFSFGEWDTIAVW